MLIIILEKTKNGNNTGTIFIAQTEIAFKQEFAYTWGLRIKTKHINKIKNVINLFDFKNFIIYNNICIKG